MRGALAVGDKLGVLLDRGGDVRFELFDRLHVAELPDHRTRLEVVVANAAFPAARRYFPPGSRRGINGQGGRGMAATETDFSGVEHDWHSESYVDWWIARDEGRDAERRQRLRYMLSHAGLARDAAAAVLDVGGGYGVVSEEVLSAFPRAA